MFPEFHGIILLIPRRFTRVYVPDGDLTAVPVNKNDDYVIVVIDYYKYYEINLYKGFKFHCKVLF